MRRFFGSARRRVLGLKRRVAGKVDLGDLARISPVSNHYGYDRGTPVDRHYIDGFLRSHSSDIRGRVLEVGESTYSRRFGSGVTRQDVLHVRAHRDATIVGDISKPGVLPDAAFDCIVIPQTLDLIYDVSAAIANLHQALRPGGAVLATLPGVTSVERGEWRDSWYWSFTGQSAQTLFADVFGSDCVEVEVHGNVYAATCFLQGLALEEITLEWLDRPDEAYPVIITVCARRPN